MLIVLAILWIVGLSITLILRTRELKKATDKFLKAEEKLNQFLYEQESKKAKSKEGSEASDNTGGTTEGAG